MKRKKTLGILCGVLAVLCICTLALSKYQIHKEKIKNIDELIIDFDVADATAIAWSHDDTDKISFVKEDGIWYWDGDKKFPVDQELVTDMLSLIHAYRASFIIESPESLGTYGLANPQCIVDVTAGDKSFSIRLGDYSAMDSERYFCIGDDNVYLATVDVLDDFECGVTEFVKLDEIPSVSLVKKFTVEGANSLQIENKEDSGICYTDKYTYFLCEDGSYKPIGANSANTLIKKLTGLTLGSFETYTADEDDLSVYGLVEPTLTVTADYEDSDNNPQQLRAYYGIIGEDGGSEAYVRLEGSQFVYNIALADAQALRDADYSSLGAKEVYMADVKTVKQFDFTIDSQTYSIAVQTDKSGKTVYSYNGQETEFADVIEALEAVKATEYTDEQPSKKQEVEILVSFDSETFPERKISVYQYNGSSCIVKIDGKPFGLVPRADVISLIEAVNEIVLE